MTTLDFLFLDGSKGVPLTATGAGQVGGETSVFLGGWRKSIGGLKTERGLERVGEDSLREREWTAGMVSGKGLLMELWSEDEFVSFFESGLVLPRFLRWSCDLVCFVGEERSSGTECG